MPNDSPALTEAEKRLHRCCFTGYRPEKLDAPEAEVEAGMSRQLDQAIADGYRTFICGMGMGVDITAGHLVMRRKESDPSLHLICAVPWPGFTAKWKYIWEAPYRFLLEQADLVKYMSKTYHDGVFRMRNEWIMNHSGRLIAYYNGTPGGTWDTIEYAVRQGISIVTNRPDLAEEYRTELEKEGLS